jgi:N-acylglucosamine 2-epimerase
MYTEKELAALAQTYRKGLLDDVLPFWIQHSVDEQEGGFLFGLDRQGQVIHSDKPVWIIGRFCWLLSELYVSVERKQEWLALARHGIDFLEAHCFDTDGRMFYSVTREGKPLRKRRYIFTETFAIAALAKYGQASGEQTYVQKAKELFELVLHHLNTPGLLEPKVNPETRQSKGLVIPMILIVTTQILREADPGEQEPYSRLIDGWIEEIERDFMKPEFAAVLEMVAPDGSLIDNFEGRLLNPGHAIEAGWFILHEARVREGIRVWNGLVCRL